jgi:hypothetical protein
MELNLTPDEYRKIIELVYLGEWMINSQHDPEFEDEDSSRILQKLLAGYRSEDVSQDEETHEYYMSSEWTDQLLDTYIADYDDHVFWDELTERLAARDLARSRGVSLEEINRDDDLLELRPLEENYRNELEDRGIERLNISEY